MFKIIEANYIGITRGGYYLQPTVSELLWVDEEIKLRKRNPPGQEKNTYRDSIWDLFILLKLKIFVENTLNKDKNELK